MESVRIAQLELQLAESKNDLEQMTTTLALAQELCLTDPARALALSVSIQEWVRPQGDRHLTMLAEALLVQSACLIGLNRPSQALPSAMEALPMLRQWQHDSRSGRAGTDSHLLGR